MRLNFPRAKIDDADYDFSFSGLKSAVLNYINGCKMKGERHLIRRMWRLLSKKQL